MAEQKSTIDPPQIAGGDRQPSVATEDETPQISGTSAAQPEQDEAPPAKPPRPLNPREQAEKTLAEAFPTIDAAVVRAVLAASGGSIEPAFDALLGMSDPSAQQEPQAPPKPPRKNESNAPVSNDRSQMEADERYARQLAQHYASREQPRQNHNPNPNRNFPQQQPSHSATEEEKQYSFIDDDLPMIRDNIRKGFLETQTTVNKWVTSFKKKLDGENDEDDDEQRPNQPPRQSQGFPPRDQSYANYNRRSAEMRRSADRERYDADPRVLGDDFSNLEMRDDEAPPKKPARPLANPDLLRSGSPGSGRKVAFQTGPAEEISDTRTGSTKPLKTALSGGGGKASKWQPLSAVEPSPVTDNDPFSLGDSDDDKDIKTKEKSDEAERLPVGTSEVSTTPLGESQKAEAGSKIETGGKT